MVISSMPCTQEKYKKPVAEWGKTRKGLGFRPRF